LLLPREALEEGIAYQLEFVVVADGNIGAASETLLRIGD
jgi:hypothetical protein